MKHTSRQSTSNDGSFWIGMGALLVAVAVATGAIGAHFLEGFLSGKEPAEQLKSMEQWNTAARYQTYQSFGLILVALIGCLSQRQKQIVALGMLVGMVLFSGCLYAYVLTGIKPLVHVVPLGGFTMIFSWLTLSWFGFSANANESGAES